MTQRTFSPRNIIHSLHAYEDSRKATDFENRQQNFCASKKRRSDTFGVKTTFSGSGILMRADCVNVLQSE